VLTLTQAQHAALAISLTLTPSQANANNGSVTWSYDLADNQLDFLAAGEALVLTYTATVNDGHGGVVSTLITVTVTGTNDVPTISATSDGFTELPGTNNAALDHADGTITFTDVDFTDQPTISAPFSSYAYTAANGTTVLTLTQAQHAALAIALTMTPSQANANNGSVTWSYDLADNQFDFLAAGETLVLTYTATVNDGHGGVVSTPVTVTIHGTNDVPTIAGVIARDVTEDVTIDNANHINTTGQLTIVDADAGQSSFAAQANTTGSYGSFALAANGTWTYTADNTQIAIQQLGINDFITDSFIAFSSDGTASQLVTVTIHGTNDIPTIAGVVAGNVTEDLAVDNANHITTTGLLTIVDADAGQFNFAAQASTAGSNGHGSFTLAANGTWNYAADNTQAAIQQLDVNDFITDSFNAMSSDGTANQLVTVTIYGSADYLLVA
jgi:VCBS repeat-containing protein